MLFDFKNVRMKENFIAEQTSLDWKENQIKRFSERVTVLEESRIRMKLLKILKATQTRDAFTDSTSACTDGSSK